jgi:GntR family transcriptional regulator, transcriptional repressor for pyruvate dehydrogenase complex
MMNFTPLKKNKRMYQRIVEQLQYLIEAGTLKPGDQLPSERILAEQLSVSRTSVKEAISVLESSGVVEVKQGIGVFLVKDRTKDMLDRITTIILHKRKDLVDLLELREAIEREAAYYAAIRFNEIDKKNLLRAFNNLKKAYENGTIGASEDYEFHMEILRASKNQLMIHMMDLISAQLLETVTLNRRETLATDGDTEAVYYEHKKIFRAIISRSPDEARAAMNDHFEATRNRHYLKEGETNE